MLDFIVMQMSRVNREKDYSWKADEQILHKIKLLSFLSSFLFYLSTERHRMKESAVWINQVST